MLWIAGSRATSTCRLTTESDGKFGKMRVSPSGNLTPAATSATRWGELTRRQRFSAIINNFNNPWLQSVGVGMRTMLSGFFSRLDLSYPIRNFEVQTPRFQVSFGYDF